MGRLLLVGISCVLVGCAFSPVNEAENALEQNAEPSTEPNGDGAVVLQHTRAQLSDDSPRAPSLVPFGSYDLSNKSGLNGTIDADFFPHPSLQDDQARRAIEKDLQLVVLHTDSRPYELTGRTYLTVKLVNRAAYKSHSVVLPKDGSESGWREPWVYYTVEKRVNDGPWQDVPRPILGRCGNYDHDWQKDVVEIAPGEAQTMSDFNFYGYDPSLEDASAMRITAHYIYRRGNVFNSMFAAGKVPESMQDVPAFTLTSEPVEIAIERPIVLEAQMKSLPSAPGGPVSNVVTVTATNTSAHDVDLPKAGGAVLIAVAGSEIIPEDGHTFETTMALAFNRTEPQIGDERITLAPGEKITLTDAQLGTMPDNYYWRVVVSQVNALKTKSVQVSYAWSFATGVAPLPTTAPEAEDSYTSPIVEDPHSASTVWIPFSNQ